MTTRRSSSDIESESCGDIECSNWIPTVRDDVLLIFLGHPKDATIEASAIRDLEPWLQGELDRIVSHTGNATVFRKVKLWEWDRDAPPEVGGQRTIITPIVDRADIAIFVFKFRPGKVTIEELNRCRQRPKSRIPIIATFSRVAPDGDSLRDPQVLSDLKELREFQQSLQLDWTARNSVAVRPLPDFDTIEELISIVKVHLVKALDLVVRSRRENTELSTPLESELSVASLPDLEYDQQPVQCTTLSQLEKAPLTTFVTSLLARDELAKSGITNVDAGASEPLQLLGVLHSGVPSLGGLLCFGTPTLLGNKFGGCSLQMVTYSDDCRAVSKASIFTAKGNLLYLFSEAMDWLKTRSGLRRQGQIGSKDRDNLEIPEIVLREALGNALIHRDYQTTECRNQPTRIEVYSDRVEITSYGCLLDAVSLEALNSGDESQKPFRRNPTIAKVFQYMTLAELNASGVPRMHLEMERVALEPPRFVETTELATFTVILKRPLATEVATLEESQYNIERTVDCQVLPYDTPVSIKQHLQIKLADVEKYQRARISDLQQQISNILIRCTQSEVFGHAYSELLLEFSPIMERIQYAVTQELAAVGLAVRHFATIPLLQVRRLINEGFRLEISRGSETPNLRSPSVKQEFSSPDVDEARHKDDLQAADAQTSEQARTPREPTHFPFEGESTPAEKSVSHRDDGFPTNDPRVRFPCRVFVEGRFRDPTSLRDYLTPSRDLETELMRLINNSAESITHTLSPQDLFLNFEESLGEVDPPAQRIRGAIENALGSMPPRGFDAECVTIHLSPLESQFSKCFDALTSRPRTVAFDVAPLDSPEESIEFKISFHIEAISSEPLAWARFQNATRHLDAEEIATQVSERIKLVCRQNLRTVPHRTLRFHSAEQVETLRRIVIAPPALQAVTRAFGLVISIDTVERSASVSESETAKLARRASHARLEFQKLQIDAILERQSSLLEKRREYMESTSLDASENLAEIDAELESLEDKLTSISESPGQDEIDPE